MKGWKAWLPHAAVIAVIIGIVCAALFIRDFYAADQRALGALNDANGVRVYERGSELVFEPEYPSRVGVVFFGDSRVEISAYAPLLRGIAERTGMTTIGVNSPFRLPWLDGGAGYRAARDHTEVQYWIVGGHASGGMVAAETAFRDTNRFRGLFLLASYPDDKAQAHFDDRQTAILCISGDQDTLMNRKRYEDAAKVMPQAEYVSIAGGGHSGFGSYGPPKGDERATLAPELQQQVTLDAFVPWAERMAASLPEEGPVNLEDTW